MAIYSRNSETQLEYDDFMHNKSKSLHPAGRGHLGDRNCTKILCEALIISVDPYARIVTQVHETVVGYQIAKVIESKSKKYPVGAHVFLKRTVGWQTHTVVNENLVKPLPMLFNGLPIQLALSMCGDPGLTAYFGIVDILKPQAGETMVISTAAGAVGSLAVQIAKLLGCKVIGFTGSDKKCEWVRNNLHADYVFNYKKVDIRESLKQAAPEGVDCFFDMVGGEFSSKVYASMRTFGRIACSGFISHYNKDLKNIEAATMVQGYMMAQQLKSEGFIVDRYEPQYDEARRQILKWKEQGLLVSVEHRIYGFENAAKAFIDMFNGGNIGKVLVFP